MSRRLPPAAAAPSARPHTPRPSQPVPRPPLRTKHRADAINRHAVRFTPPGYEEAASVLKITRLLPRGRGLTIKLEGELFEAWVGSVRDACASRGPRPLRLDLADVSYVDAAGLQLLLDLMAEGAEIATCSGFVGELLNRKS
jgi:hypothetical protein